MTNESIVNMYPRPDPKNMERALNLARANEREQMQVEIENLKNKIIDSGFICCNNFHPMVDVKVIEIAFNAFLRETCNSTTKNEATNDNRNEI